MIPVSADEEVTISAWDPTTNARDEVKIIVKEGETRNVFLTPRTNLRGSPQ